MPPGQGFAAGTMLATAAGRRGAEQVGIGDELLEAAGAPRRVRWAGRICLSPAYLAEQPEAQPIRVHAGALGEGLPRRDLVVAPQTELACTLPDGTQVTLSARLLLNGRNITREPPTATIELFEFELEDGAGVIAEDLPAGFQAPEHTSPAMRIAAVRAQSLVAARGGCVPGPLLGRVDRLERGLVYGWALDEQRPWLRMALEVVVNGRVHAGIIAGLRRNDLVRAGLGDGACGFHFEPRPPLPADRTLLVQVRRAADGLDLPGSPVLLPRTGGPAELLEALPPTTPAKAQALRTVLREGLDRLQGPVGEK